MSKGIKLLKREKNDLYLHSTELENLFINEFLPAAPGDYVKIYIFCLMYAENGLPLSTEELLSTLSIDRETLDNAWTYWEKTGLIRKVAEDSKSTNAYSVEFLDQIEKLYGMGAQKSHKSGAGLEETGSISEPQSSGSARGSDALIDQSLQEVLIECENGLARPLSTKETEAVRDCIDQERVTYEVFSYALDYSLQLNKKNINYICTVAANWSGHGCKTIDDVKELLADEGRRWTYYRLVFREMGFNRAAAPGDMEIMDSWLDDLGYTQEQVLQVCREKAGMREPTLKYMNAVLRNKALEKGGINTRKNYGNSGTDKASASGQWKKSSGSGEAPAEQNNQRVGQTAGARQEEPVSPDWNGSGKARDKRTMVSRRVLKEYYEYIRQRDRDKLNERIREVCRREPLMEELLELENGVNSTSLAAAVKEGREGRAAARKRRRQIEEEKKKLLTARGYAEDYLDMHYLCSKCKDTGTDDEGRSCDCVKQRAEEAYRWNIRRNQTR